MLEYNYTLNDSIFKYALKNSAYSHKFLSGKKLMISGGAATQLLMRDETYLLRPTDDIDLISQTFLTKKERKEWTKSLAEKIRLEGFKITKRLTEDNAEIKFEGLKDELFIKLNCYNQYYYQRYKRKLKGEFERALTEEFEGSYVVYQHPIDIISNKLERIISYNKILDIPLNQNTINLLTILKQGDFDEIKAEDYLEDLDALVYKRQLNVEDLGRMSPKEIRLKIEGYKIQKDVYDICRIIESTRKRKISLNRNQFLDALKLTFINHPNH